MKRYTMIFLFLSVAFLLFACKQEQSESQDAVLSIGDGILEVVYSSSELHDFPMTLATVDGITYVGVPLTVLLQDAGFTPDQIEYVMAVATDDFSATYEPAVFMLPDTIVAYERIDGELTREELPFRMALPGKPGRLNVRMLSRVEVHS